MTENTEHTPLLWRLESDGSICGADAVQTNGWLKNRGRTSNRSYSDVVCKIYGCLDLPAPAANAALIVRACNSHDALLAACEEAGTYLERRPEIWKGKEPESDDPIRTIYWVLRAAIALAKKEA